MNGELLLASVLAGAVLVALVARGAREMATSRAIASVGAGLVFVFATASLAYGDLDTAWILLIPPMGIIPLALYRRWTQTRR